MRLPVFRSGHEGFGDARRLYRRFSYNRAFGSVDLRSPGELRAGAAIDKTSITVSDVGWKEPPIKAVQWESATGDPIILITGDDKTKMLKYGAVTLDSALTTTATDGCLHDDGAGIPYYYTCYGGAAASSKMQRRNRAATYAAMTNLVADKLLSLGGELYGTRVPASGTAASAVWKIAAGTSITAAIALPTGTAVGFPGTPINSLRGVRRKVVANKPEGVFTYDRATDLWFNHAPWLEAMPHSDNGKVAWNDEHGDLIIALGNGGALRFDGEVCTPFDPLGQFDSLPDENTTMQTIAAGGALRHWSLMATKIGARKSRIGGTGSAGTAGIKAGKSVDSGATYGTDYSTGPLGFNASSSAMDLSSLATATDYIVIGHPEPFAAWLMTMFNANSNAAVLTAEIWTGSAWTAIDVTDLTIGGNTATPISLSRTGWIGFDRDPVAMGWVASSLTLNGNAFTRFWVRLKWSADLDASTNVASLDVLPARPSIDRNLALTGTWIDDWRDRAGILPHFLAMRRDAEGGRIAHDLGSTAQSGALVGAMDEIGCMIYGNAGLSLVTNVARVPMFFGKNYAWSLNLPDDDRTQLHPWTVLNPRGLVELPAIDLAATDIDGPGKLKEVWIDGEDWHATGYVWARFLNGQPWKRVGSFDSLPARLDDIGGLDGGRWLQFAVGWEMTAAQTRSPGTPRIFEIDAEVEKYSGVVRRLPRQSPAVV